MYRSYRSQKTGAVPRSGSKTSDYFADNQKTFSRPNYRVALATIQCVECGSDYMRASLNKLCQWCLQHAEFVTREGLDRPEGFRKGGRL